MLSDIDFFQRVFRNIMQVVLFLRVKAFMHACFSLPPFLMSETQQRPLYANFARISKCWRSLHAMSGTKRRLKETLIMKKAYLWNRLDWFWLYLTMFFCIPAHIFLDVGPNVPKHNFLYVIPKVLTHSFLHIWAERIVSWSHLREL